MLNFKCVALLALLYALVTEASAADELKAGYYPASCAPQVTKVSIIVARTLYTVPVEMRPDLPNTRAILYYDEMFDPKIGVKRIYCQQSGSAPTLESFALREVVGSSSHSYLRLIDKKFAPLAVLDYVRVSDPRFGNISGFVQAGLPCSLRNIFGRSLAVYHDVDTVTQADPKDALNLEFTDGPSIFASCGNALVYGSRWCKARSMISTRTCIEISFHTSTTPFASVRQAFDLLADLINPLASDLPRPPP